MADRDEIPSFTDVGGQPSPRRYWPQILAVGLMVAIGAYLLWPAAPQENDVPRPAQDARAYWGGKWAFRGYLAAVVIVLVLWGAALDYCAGNCLRIASDAWHILTR